MTTHNPTPGSNRCSEATLKQKLKIWLATVLLIKTKFSSLKSGNNDRRKNGGGHPGAKLTAPVSRERPAVTLSLGAMRKAPRATFKWDAMTIQWPISSVKNGLSRQITNKKVKT